MCFHYSLHIKKETLEARFSAKIKSENQFKINFLTSAFNFPAMPVLASAGEFTFSTWGLIPAWVKNTEKADEIRKMTLNAKSETLDEKPSFRGLLKSQRVLVPANGFFEWRLYQGKKYPYFIALKNIDTFCMGGLYSTWRNPVNEEIVNTFTIITTPANKLMEQIHNEKKRMPLIIDPVYEKDWIDNKLPLENVKSLMVAYDPEKMKAKTVSNLISTKGIDRNVEKVFAEQEYSELPGLQ